MEEPHFERHFAPGDAADDGPAPVVCDVSGLARPGPADLDRLTRLRLDAARAGRRLVLRGAGPRLRLLLVLTGLAELFPDEPPPCSGPSGGDALGAEPLGQPP